MWREPAILTLTVDRACFASPQDAHGKISGGKFIPRLMRMLGVRLWMWCLEFQQATGEGWPHWHLLVDLADLPGRRIDLKRAWTLWRDTWHLGGLDLSTKKTGMTSAHALNYITKYLTKFPDGGFPEWVLHAHSLRFVQGSRALGPLVGKISYGMPPDEEEEEEESPREHVRKPNLEANSRCGLMSTVMREEIDGCTGELRYRFLGALPVSPGFLLSLAYSPGDCPGRFVRAPDALASERSMVLFAGNVDEVRRWLERHADPQGYLRSEVEFQREGILLMNAYANRHALS